MRIGFSRSLAPLIACAALAFAAEVSTDYNHQTDFSRYRTYSWLGVRAGGLWQDRIMRAVDGQLSAKGWSRVESGGDATVSAIGKVTEQDTLETFYNGFPGWGWRGWGGGLGESTTTTVPEKVGNLTVHIFDGSRKQLIWRGSAAEAVSSKPDKDEKRMDEAVNKMFKHFPPPSKG